MEGKTGVRATSEEAIIITQAQGDGSLSQWAWPDGDRGSGKVERMNHHETLWLTEYGGTRNGRLPESWLLLGLPRSRK